MTQGHFTLLNASNVLRMWMFLLYVTYISAAWAYNYESNQPNTIAENVNSCGCAHGAPGPPGVPGIPGMNGNHGHDGRKGEKGLGGEQGLPGLKGQTGPMGPIGQTGGRGKKGTHGETGPIGDRGLIGNPGLPGLTGPPGRQTEVIYTGPDGLIRPHPQKHYAFSVVRSSKIGPLKQDATITFDSIITNVGGGFQAETSHFKCPQNGTYMFTTHMLSQEQHSAHVWIMLNSQHIVPMHGDGRTGYGTASQSIILQLHKDDRVWLQLPHGNALLNDYSTFSGYILFEDD